jgi:hypothetical protein
VALLVEQHKKQNAQSDVVDTLVHDDYAKVIAPTQMAADTTRVTSKVVAISSRQITRHEKFLKKVTAHLA